MSARRLDAAALRDWAHAAVADLIAHTDEINRLNVFPVADADTGTNMLFTMRAACAQADAHDRSADVAAVAAALAEGALHGARGNSGVILSQILRGLADVAAEAAGERAGVLHRHRRRLLAAALRHAVGLVVASVGESGRRAPSSRCCRPPRPPPRTRRRRRRGPAATVMRPRRMRRRPRWRETTQQLDVLAEAGVVDAGGRGLLVLLDAMTATLTGHAPHRRPY